MEKVVWDRERVSVWDTVGPAVDAAAVVAAAAAAVVAAVVVAVVVVVVVVVVAVVAAPPPAWGLLSRDLSPGEPGAAPRRTWRSRLVRKEFCGR